MRTLVAGGAGFIGSHLDDALIAAGHDVVVVDNFYRGTWSNIAHLKDNPHFKLYEINLCDRDALMKVFDSERIDYVFHLAANSDIQASAKDPTVEYDNTYTTTFNLLECMRTHQVKRFFFASTSAVYGDQMEIALDESATLLPVSYYGACKMGSEGIINAFSYMNDMSSLVFRFPNVIGPRLTHGVIYDFIGRLREDSTQLTILGDGTQSKPYMLVSDLVEGIMAQSFQIVDKGVRTFNIGVETHTSVTKIADIVCNKMNLDIPYNYTGGKVGWKGDVPRFSYDLRKIHSTGWHAKYTSDEAVEATVESALQ